MKKGLLLLLSTGLLPACAVYVPVVPRTPVVQKGQVEITAGLRSLTTLEAGAAWAPTAHLLLSGEAALQQSNSTTTTNNTTQKYVDSHRQVGLGIGAYTMTTAPKPLYLAALIGAGHATADIHTLDLFSPLDHYEANYWRYYGQAYLAKQERKLTWGISVRATWLNYQQLQLNSTDAAATASKFFLEPHFFLRIGQGPVQAYGTFGISSPLTRNDTPGIVANSVVAPSSTLIGAGIVFRPWLLKKNNE
jgi:hypothetical protein